MLYLPARFDVRSTFGALLLGGLIAASLSGLLIAQVVFYCKTNTDSRYIRAMVCIILFFDISHSVLLFMGMWTWFIRFHETTSAVFLIPISISVSVIITALTTLIAHAFFGWRIFKRTSPHLIRFIEIYWRFPVSNKNIWLLISIAIPAILSLVFAGISQVEMIRYGSFQRFRDRTAWPFTADLALSAAVDVMITVMMMILLRQSRRKSLSLDAVIDSLFMLTLENGAITSLAAIICMVFWLTLDNFVFMGLYFIIDKLYANSILAVLNYRKHLAQKHDGRSRSSGHNMFDLNVVRFSDSHSQPPPPPPPRPLSANRRSASTRALLRLPSHLCPSMREARLFRMPSSEKVFEISVERSVELHTDELIELGGDTRSKPSASDHEAEAGQNI
ncbi:hypothetical protein EV361DRAFT_1007268 [Lentinula raphanica]|nr:hypothetical protein F5880DRAFT_1612298 [Lentinula raphanica]KAJ3967680.1 hypothetical protein EV361DRAFT_1007268 [Lentinula raphanica]